MTERVSTKRPIRVHSGVVREFLFASRFGLVGGAATIVHIVIVSLLIANTDLPILVANLIAFLAAFGISFSGNYIWTFGSPGSPHSAMRRFLIISTSAFAANSLLLASLTSANYLSPTVSAVSAAAIVPLFTYTASRFWGFKVRPLSKHGATTSKPKAAIAKQGCAGRDANHIARY